MRSAPLVALAALLVGCASLPSTGPSTGEIEDRAGATTGALTYALVELDYAMTERIKQAPATPAPSLAALANTASSDSINIGDELQITLFDPSGTLFAGRLTGTGGGANNQTLPPVVVARDGTIAIPFGGAVRVVGLTAREASAAVVRSLRGKAVNPQALVTVARSPANGIVVLGEVRAPGRATVQPGAENLLDAIAAAGGPSRNIDDITVSVSRSGQVFEAPLRKVLSTFDENIRLHRGDQVNLAYTPRRYVSFGALNNTSQFEMPTGVLTLTGAMAQVGGLNPQSADARSVMIFRYERPEVAALAGVDLPPTTKGVPVIYRINLEDPTGFFVADNFVIQPEDIVYAPLAGAAEMRRFFDFVRSITSIAYDVRVAGSVAGN